MYAVLTFEHYLALFDFFMSSLLHKVCKELAEWYFQDGCSVLAACCHLAVDNIKVLKRVCACNYGICSVFTLHYL